MIRTILPALAIAALAPYAALAGQDIKVPPFKSIELHGGGQAILRHGDRQRVVLIKGDPAIAEIQVVGDGKLVLSPCRNTCWGNHELEVEVTTPAISAIAVHGGGEAKVRAERTLPADVHGGGEVRFWGHPEVNSSTHGGGSVESGE